MRSTSKVIALLQDVTVARGATPAEADVAAAKASELSQSEERAEAEAQLQGLGWSEVAAKGMVAALDRLPPWEADTDWRYSLLCDRASCSNHLDPTTLETQLRFLSDDLRNTFQQVGAAISVAKTEEEATKAFKPYADKLLAHARREESP